MPRASKTTSTASKKTSVKKASAKARVSKVNKTATLKTVPVQEQLSAFFNNLRGKSASRESQPRFNKKVYLPLLGLVVVLGLLYLAGRYLVVAWVDKKPITRWEYYNQLGAKYGHDLREQLIVESLVNSEAQKRHLTVSDQEINNEIAKIEQEQGGASQLDQILQMQGISRSELHNLVRLQILRQKMFSDQSQVTDNEINQYIEQNKASLPQTDPNNASAEANLKDNVRQQLKQQKINASFSAWLQQNINSNRVIRL